MQKKFTELTAALNSLYVAKQRSSAEFFSRQYTGVMILCKHTRVCVCACVCACMRERERIWPVDHITSIWCCETSQALQHGVLWLWTSSHSDYSLFTAIGYSLWRLGGYIPQQWILGCICCSQYGLHCIGKMLHFIPSSTAIYYHALWVVIYWTFAR